MKYIVTLKDKTYEVEVEEGEAMILDEYEVKAPAAPAPAAMPKDDDWDLPADLDGNNAFVPLEAGE